MSSPGAADLTGSVITPAQTPPTADTNLQVLSRSDGRVVYHLGILNPAPPADGSAALAENLGPYTIGPFNVPAHWWCARWTDRTNCPITIKKSPAQIVSAKRMFPYAPIGVPLDAQPSRVPYTLMGSSSVVIYEPTTGERPDIGLITDNSAFYMLGDDPSPMIDWALVGETCPLHFRDQTTGLPINLLTYPTANSFDAPGYQGSPWLAKGPPNPNQGGYSTFGGNWTPQQAHHPEYDYMAFEATGDLGFLESLQFHANFMVLTNATLSGQQGKATITGEYRGISWGLRTLFMAHIATADAESLGPLPSYLLPSSYFKTLLDQQLAYYGAAITSTGWQQTFHLVSPQTPFAPWQCDYMLSALGFGVLTGHSDWAPLYLWALNNAIDRLSGTSGYPPGWGGAYYLDATQNSWAAAFAALQTNNQGSTAPTAAQVAALTADPFNGGVAMQGQQYLMTTRSIMVHAQYLDSQGILPVRTTFTNLDACFAAADKMIKNYGSVDPRESTVSNPALVSTVIVPYVPEPPEGTITMPSSSLIVGTTHTATFTANGPLYGTPAWTITPSTAATLTPAAPSASTPDVATCGVAFLAAGAFTLSCVGQADPTVGVNPITASLAGTVILQEATSATLTLV